MKYLIIATSNQTPMPPEMAEKIYQAAMAWVDERIKNGKIDCTYVFIGGGGLSIGNVNSQEELYDELLSYPLYMFFDWDVTPLVEWKHGYNSAMESYKKMVVK